MVIPVAAAAVVVEDFVVTAASDRIAYLEVWKIVGQKPVFLQHVFCFFF